MKRKRRAARERSERTRDFTLVLDGQLCPQRMTRGRKTKAVKRALRAFGVERGTPLAQESCSHWEYDQHLLFWELLGYDGRYWIGTKSGLPGMIGETKRLIAECHRD